MSREVWERAVEAGAEALCRTIHPGRFAGEFDYWRSRRIRPATKEAFRKEAADCLRAAFPILAEELAGEIEQTAAMAERRSAGAHRVGDTSTSTHERAIALGRMDAADFIRARIQQMKEGV